MEDFGLPDADEDSPLMALVGDGPSFATPQFALVEFLNLQTDQVFDKVQCRKGGVARQVLKDAVIHMKASYSPATLYQIIGSARREEEAARLVGDLNKDDYLMKSNNEVWNLAENVFDQEYGAAPVPEVVNGQTYLTLKFFVDLGKIYSDKKNPMFKLVKTDTVTRNRFKLRIQLRFLDRSPSEIFESPVFRCRTKKNEKDLTSPVEQMVTTPEQLEPESPSAITLTQVITDSLTARTARIEDLVFGSMSTDGSMSTRNADIAYHLKIKDEDLEAELQEGDVVGFFTDDHDEGTYVKLLHANDIENAIHAGVVSRSHYIAANKIEGKTDTVCVIGIVNVKVIGSVENGERIYASIDRPGKAVPQSHLPIGSFLRKKHVLLGMSMERKSPKSLEEAHLVKSFVCIVLDVGRQDVLNEVEEIYELSEKSTKEQIKFASRKTWRKLKCCFALTLIFFLLLAFLLYQVFVPGSMFRYWLCRRGSLSGNVYVSVVTFRARTERISVHGIQFTYHDLKGKVWERFPKNNGTGHRRILFYFLNLDRCAYFGDQGPVRDYFNGKYKEIGGGKILAVNTNCTYVYWYGLHPDYSAAGLKWYPYVSAQNLECTGLPNLQ